MNPVLFLRLAACLLLCGGHLFPLTIRAQASPDPSFVFYLNDEAISPEVLRHRTICANSTDVVRIVFEGGPATQPYLLTGMELWAQVTLGQPQVLAKEAYSEPAEAPVYVFRVADLNLRERLPAEAGAIRATIRLGQVARVEGRRVVDLVDLSESARSFSFMLVRDCD